MKGLVAACLALLATSGQASIVDKYLERYFETFPTRATAVGRHEYDRRLEDLGSEEWERWLEYNRHVGAEIRRRVPDAGLDSEARRDLQLLQRQVEQQRLDWKTLRRPERDPLFWTDLLSEATIYLPVREVGFLRRRGLLGCHFPGIS